MSPMTPRERILAALDHRQPDRLPMDFGGLNTSIHHEAHSALIEHLRLEPSRGTLRNLFSNVMEPDPRLVELFGRDVAPFFPRARAGWKLEIDPETDSFVDEWGTTFHRPPGGYYYDAVPPFPLEKAETLEEVDAYRWPDPRDPARMEGVAQAVKEAHEKGDRAVMFASQRLGLWTQPWVLRGLEQAFIDLVAEPAIAERLAEKTLEWQMDYWDAVLSRVGQHVDVVHLEGDLGDINGPLFSPAIFKRVYVPRLASLISFIKARTRAKIYLHACGAVHWAIPDLIECGVDALNPVQVNARDMDSAKLKREFGSDITFWGGGCDPVLLHHGTPEEVDAEVRRRVEDMAPGGGFVFGSVHNIQVGVPPRNIVAMYQAARKHGGYED